MSNLVQKLYNTTVDAYLTAHEQSINLYSWACDSMIAAGWIFHDTDTHGWNVYKTNGENGDYPLCYIHLSTCDASCTMSTLFNSIDSVGLTISARAFGFWDNIAHTYNNQASMCNFIALSATRRKICFWGDKNFIYFYKFTHEVGSFNNQIFAGYPTHFVYNPTIFISAQITAGTNVIITTANDTSQFIVGKIYAILDETNGNINEFTLISKTSTTLTASAITKTFTTGSRVSFFGFNLFGVTGFSAYNGISPISHVYWQTGEGDNLNRYSAIWRQLNLERYQNPVTWGATLYQRAVLVNPAFFSIWRSISFDTSLLTIQQSNISLTGYYHYDSLLDINLVYLPEDSWNTKIFSLPLDTREFCCVSVMTNNTVTIANKNWIDNQWSGYTCVVIIGNGAEQCRLITSNTANTITLNEPMTFYLSKNSIIEIVYRAFVLGYSDWDLGFAAINYDGYRPNEDLQ